MGDGEALRSPLAGDEMLDARALAKGVVRDSAERLFVCDAAAVVLEASDAARALFQRDPPFSVLELVEAEHRASLTAGLDHARGGSVWRGGLPIRGQPWDWSARAAGGLLVVRLGVPEGALELDAGVRRFLDRVGEAVLVHDLPEGRFVAVNGAACELVGYSRDELMQLRVTDLGVGFSPAELRGQWDAAVRGEPVTVTDRLRRRDGTAVDLEVRLALVETPGRRLVVVTARDISDRLLKEQALVAALARAEREAAILDAIFNALPHAVFFADRSGIVRANDLARAALERSGVEHTLGMEALAERFQVRPVNPDRRPTRAASGFARALAGEKVTVESWVTAPGTPDDALIRTTYAPVTVGGAPIGAVAVNVDLTEQHHLRSRLDVALSAARLGWWDHDLARHVITLDERCRTILGVSSSELGVADVPALVHPDDLPGIMRILEPGSPESTLRTMKVRVVRPSDGAVVWLEATWVWIARTPGRPPTNIIGTAADVTAQHESEHEVARLAAAVEQSPASIVITDAAGRIEYVNPAFVRITGYGRDEVKGQKPSILKSGQHPLEVYRELWAEIGAGRTWHGRLVNRAKDGHLFTEDTIIAPVWGPGGRISHYVAVKRDITDELRMQQAFANAQRMESVGRLAGGVAHDFNNLLTVILSSVEAQEEQLAAGAPMRGEEVAEIRAAAERAADLTRQLLAFARKQPVEPRVIDVNSVIAPMERLLRRVLGEDIRVEVQLDGDLWPTRADHAQLEQVLMNLVVNARDAMPGGGTLTISTHRLAAAEVPATDSEAAGNDWVVLRVRDTGVGIPLDIQPNLFEPFFTTKPKGKGTGLGLSSVFGIVSQAQGHVRVASAPGHGATFEVRLPRFRGPTENEPVSARGVKPAGGGETILLVEDDPGVRDVAGKVLEAAGYRVLQTAAGADGLQTLGREPSVRLLVTDVVMPEMSGPELVRRARQLAPTLKALFMSGYSVEVADVSEPFLEKPFTPAQLLARVRTILDG